MGNHSLAGIVLTLTIMGGTLMPGDVNSAPPDVSLSAGASQARRALIDKHGDGEEARIERGIEQVRNSWREEMDGDGSVLRDFLEEEFVPVGPGLDAVFNRLEYATAACRQNHNTEDESGRNYCLVFHSGLSFMACPCSNSPTCREWYTRCPDRTLNSRFR